ncbi:MAG: sigma 54-dependent Fis family transcriptional regulator [Deltaproteobacteria bacterium]|nr:sigma 54-dependent Fis family transcriptional regulator [Deltaproteobacteria bacterium]
MSSDTRTRSLGLPSLLPRLTEGRVRILDGADGGRRLVIDKEPRVLGSAPACDLRLPDDRVSHRHCEVRLGARGFLVRDLGSRNGTYFEGARVNEIAVPAGAILQLGHTHVVLEAPGETTNLDPSSRERFGRLVGQSVPMRRAFALLERAAAADVTVLLQGETGTGKELAARALHDESARRGGPFEVFDGGVVSTALLPSRLFGHLKGAFTGATEDHAGVFERADGGTVFLDEIGELPLEVQATLLRVCEARTVTPLGSAVARPVDVRLVAATNRDLASEVLRGTFRRDLYYRLQVLPIRLPPLRTRRADLPELCTELLQDLGLTDPGPIDGPVLAQLQSHPFPGNVRELRNVLERAVVRAGRGARFCDLVLELGPAEPGDAGGAGGARFQDLKQETINRFECDYLSRLLEEHGGNIRQASAASGLERTQLKRLLRKHGLI